MPSLPGKITFGRQLESIETGGFTLTETQHDPGLRLPRHEHECANFNLTLRGSCRETVAGRTEDCGPSSLAIKPPGAAHSNHYGLSGARCLIVEVTPARLAALGAHARLFDAPSYTRGGPLVALAARMYAELRRGGCASELVIEGLALEFLGAMARGRTGASSPGPPSWLREARDRVHASFGEPIGLSALAGSAGVDPTHFARAFRRWFGCSVGEYVRRLRLEHAAGRLAASEEPLAEIATACGFFDQSHLTNVFKLHLGFTPAEYRAAVRRGRSAPRRPRASKTLQGPRR